MIMTYINSIKPLVHKYLMELINHVQYPLFELFYGKQCIPVYGGFERFAFYTKRDNIGDDLNIDFFEALTKKHIIKAEYSYFVHKRLLKPYSLVGSILEYSYKQEYPVVVWGSGFKSSVKDIIPEQIKKNNYLAVRGPKSREIILNYGGVCPPVYGDPIVLISKYFSFEVKKHYKYGFVPHKKDANLDIINKLRQNSEVKVIKIYKYHDWKSLIEEFLSCEFIVSSSLHGIIISDSYKIPNIWCRFSDYIDGGGFKFDDYFLGVSKQVECVDLSRGIDYGIIDFNIRKWTAPVINPEFEESCPFNLEID